MIKKLLLITLLVISTLTACNRGNDDSIFDEESSRQILLSAYIRSQTLSNIKFNNSIEFRDSSRFFASINSIYRNVLYDRDNNRLGVLDFKEDNEVKMYTYIDRDSIYRLAPSCGVDNKLSYTSGKYEYVLLEDGFEADKIKLSFNIEAINPSYAIFREEIFNSLKDENIQKTKITIKTKDVQINGIELKCITPKETAESILFTYLEPLFDLLMENFERDYALQLLIKDFHTKDMSEDEIPNHFYVPPYNSGKAEVLMQINNIKDSFKCSDIITTVRIDESGIIRYIKDTFSYKELHTTPTITIIYELVDYGKNFIIPDFDTSKLISREEYKSRMDQYMIQITHFGVPKSNDN